MGTAKKAKLKLTLEDGSTVKVKVLATFRDLALHVSVHDDERITITHVPTGCAVMHVSPLLIYEIAAPLLLHLSNALKSAKPGDSISSDVGRRALPWIDLIKAMDRAMLSLAGSKPYTPVAINRPKVRRTYQRPPNAPMPIPNMVSISAQAAA